uniref:Uncharacterized protein n=1 Tax=Chromera velia CCMP2878 TaxID=1169474 RepID=A0A0G4I3S5_9ALVE|eukprot:Cvel_10691.t1-p1 / transcript=Cvel_10691.t1 / gene=Cvel_10691 / organism=Chromera_velia_CCMP2878 / gene_product=hypothetical protein / transcript_product=hypothetical protein / location=Cvel_scaffold650:16773-18439(+) / protein_length=323 / sequence_SO=supercontig / SO=protein_coding / is_pseudo=false
MTEQSSVLTRLRGFLPALKEANKALEETGDARENGSGSVGVSSGAVGDPSSVLGGAVVEMSVAMGVYDVNGDGGGMEAVDQTIPRVDVDGKFLQQGDEGDSVRVGEGGGRKRAKREEGGLSSPSCDPKETARLKAVSRLLQGGAGGSSGGLTSSSGLHPAASSSKENKQTASPNMGGMREGTRVQPSSADARASMSMSSKSGSKSGEGGGSSQRRRLEFDSDDEEDEGGDQQNGERGRGKKCRTGRRFVDQRAGIEIHCVGSSGGEEEGEEEEEEEEDGEGEEQEEEEEEGGKREEEKREVGVKRAIQERKDKNDIKSHGERA